MTFTRLSQREMDRAKEALMDHRVGSRYSVADLSILTGIPEDNIRHMERTGLIARADHIEGPNNNRRWEEESARAVLGYIWKRPVKKDEMLKLFRDLRKAKFDGKYTIGDIHFLTGWTENYIRILERRGKIPKARRDGTDRGFGIMSGPKRGQRLGCRYWDEDGAKAILCLYILNNPRQQRF